MRNKALLGVILVILGALGFSTKAIFVKLIYEYHVDSVTLMSLRMLLSLPFYLLIAFLFNKRKQFIRLNKSQIFHVIWIGILGYYISNILDLKGLQYIPANLERLILFLYPTFVLLISAFIWKKRLQLIEVLALIVSYVGIALIVAHDFSYVGDAVITGGLFVLGSAISFAIFNVGSGLAMREIGSIQFTCYAMLSASVLIIGHFLLKNDWHVLFTFPDKVYFMALLLAIFSTVLPSFLMAEGMNRLGANRASIVATIGPVATAVLAAVFLAESFTWIHAVGMLFVVGGVGMITFYK